MRSAPLRRQRASLGRILLAAAAVALPACGDISRSVAPDTPPAVTVTGLPDADLVFVGDDAAGRNIFGYRVRDGALFNVTSGNTSYWGMGLSPSGTKVAVAATRQGCREILVIDLETRAELSVSERATENCVYSPRWSPDGGSVVYSNLRGGYHINVVSADGFGRRVIVPSEGLSTYLMPHGWDPAGRLVYHRRVGSGPTTAHVIGLDGSVGEPLFGRGTDRTPTWTGDGSRVAFVREEAGRRTVWVADGDGSNAVRVSDPDSDADLGYAFAATDFAKEYWSPDGQWLAITRDSSFRYAVELVRADGSERRRLTDFHAAPPLMGWTTEGRVSFLVDVGGEPTLHLAWPDGSGTSPVTLPVRIHGNALWRRASVGQQR